jgi:4-amino-4-deoxy-L-arabinose transferase-like glycosyltransferase
MIAGCYALIHDWILSARLISLVFGTALLVPLYLILKEWVRDESAVLCLLVFAVTPVLVSNSAELVRDPICWFFLASGICAVIRQGKTHASWLLLASFCFLAAAWARIEAVLFLAVTLGFLICHKPKISRILIFLSPLVVLLIFSIAALMFSSIPLNDLHRGHEIAGKFIEPIRQYQIMAKSLKTLNWSSPNPFMEFFLPEARNLIWLIALGTLLNRFLEAFFYPFVVLYVLGICGFYRKIRLDARLLYLAVLTVSILAVLYMHTLQTWMLYYRFFGIVMIPASVLCAFGLETLLKSFSQKFNLRQAAVFLTLFLVIIAVSLPKNLKPPDADKSVFVQIGQTVFDNLPAAAPARIATSRHTQIWVSFYANLKRPETLTCPLDVTRCWESFPDDPIQFKKHLRQNRLDFLLWEEKRWPFLHFTPSDPDLGGFYRELGRWEHRDTGKMILFAVIPAPGEVGR